MKIDVIDLVRGLLRGHPIAKAADVLEAAQSALKPEKEGPLEGRQDLETRIETGRVENGKPEATDIHTSDTTKLDPTDADEAVAAMAGALAPETDPVTQKSDTKPSEDQSSVVLTSRTRAGAAALPKIGAASEAIVKLVDKMAAWDTHVVDLRQFISELGTWYDKEAGYDQPGTRTGTGPASGSYQEALGLIGRRQAAGEACPVADAVAPALAAAVTRTGEGPRPGSQRVAQGLPGVRQEAGEVCPAVSEAEEDDEDSKKKTDDEKKTAGYDQPGTRTGTGPAKGSYREAQGLGGRRQAAGEVCPVKPGDKKDKEDDSKDKAKAKDKKEAGIATSVKLATALESVRRKRMVRQAVKTAKARLGSGKRFKSLEAKLDKQPGVKDPGALAASIGRKKLGNKKFQSLSKKGARPEAPAASEAFTKLIAASKLTTSEKKAMLVAAATQIARDRLGTK